MQNSLKRWDISEFPSERVAVNQNLASCLTRQHCRGRRHTHKKSLYTFKRTEINILSSLTQCCSKPVIPAWKCRMTVSIHFHFVGIENFAWHLVLYYTKSKSHGFGTTRVWVKTDKTLILRLYHPLLLYKRNARDATRSNGSSKSCLKVLIHRQCVCILHWCPSWTPLPSEASSALFTRSPLLQKRDYPVTNSVQQSETTIHPMKHAWAAK